MVVEWTESALSTADRVLDYTYNKYGQVQVDRLQSEFLNAAKQIERYPQIGSLEASLKDVEGEYRYLLVYRVFKMVYRIDNLGHVSIITIWDCRRNPENLLEVVGDADE